MELLGNGLHIYLWHELPLFGRDPNVGGFSALENRVNQLN